MERGWREGEGGGGGGGGLESPDCYPVILLVHPPSLPPLPPPLLFISPLPHFQQSFSVRGKQVDFIFFVVD